MRRFRHSARARDLRHRRTAAAAAAVLLLVGAATGCSSSNGPDDTLADFLTGWRSGNLDKVGFVRADGGSIKATEVLDQLQALAGDLARSPLVLNAQGEPKVTGDIAAGAIKLDWTLPGGTPWSYQSTVRMTKQDSDGWRVVWEPAIVQSELTTGDRLALRRVPAKRATILDGAGQPIVTPQQVVTIGVSPEKIKDLAQLTADLRKAFDSIDVDVDLKALKGRVAKADPGAFLDLVTLRRPDYNKIRDDVRPLNGTVFREEERLLAPTREFARALLGTVDPATKDDLVANPDTVAAGELVGHGGLQQRYDNVLRGIAGTSVVISRKSPDDNTVEDAQLFSTPPQAGTPVKTTLNAATQRAADAAVGAEPKPSALVAVRISDGNVLAVANGPDGGGVNTAFTAQVPPGSTWKMASALGLLTKKAVTADEPVDCPKTATVDGREFRNAAGEVLGKVPFHTDFAKSCNTAFVGLAPKLGADGLAQSAALLGVGAQWDMGIEAFSGKVSTGATPTELAAAAFGQGTTVVSPLAMAGATAAVARGQFRQPRLITEPAPARPAADGPALDATAVGAVRDMMREVVTSGTGTGLRNVPGKPVSGKTGTAEFADGQKDTHAWFVGWQGDVAFAVMVEKGGAGAEAAVPIVNRFLTTLNR
ncbi:cell division protein FtsI/penicillin-binding protein 2 [Krasilnikovia cinnamomea]|uniref:Cell division protein FtsI/penicillin-binding protein 2 n=1 Tax=Krasilnikovia cinnamomea TaxID=349313 RepID=A0A4Q7ZGK9_9ACTN|nr:penicillin-binding transpeptidase domain-containing protein [Krasilnikovia cinnamomea]RZU49888.1 cell division protein FtsI/penicillin-binding protein 2 [Krasilnikovia cinnamomea]